MLKQKSFAKEITANEKVLQDHEATINKIEKE